MNVVDRRFMRHPSGVRRYSSLYQPIRCRVRLLVDEQEVLHSRRSVAVYLDHRHVAHELTARCGSKKCAESLESVCGAEDTVRAVRSEDLQPTVVDELAGELHVPRAQGMYLDEILETGLGDFCFHGRLRLTVIALGGGEA